VNFRICEIQFQVICRCSRTWSPFSSTSTIGSHQQRSESKWVRPTGISTDSSARQIKFSISVSPHPRKRKHDTARVGCLTRIFASFPRLLRPQRGTRAAVKPTPVKCQQVSKCQPVGSSSSSLPSVSQVIRQCSQPFPAYPEYFIVGITIAFHIK
jgi:hypothetical protein